jgi:hypothetical protein
MWLMRLAQVDDDRDLRTFKCQVCELTESVIVEFKHHEWPTTNEVTSKGK